MSNLILKGKVNIEGMKFNHIEGGFGKDKKAILVKDIALIHGKELKDINRNINNNIKRFRENIDIIDLKKLGDSKPLTLMVGYNNQSYANANNIYLLSERGYSKLLKIIEDDFAWEQYEKLVDGYFNMRKYIRNESIDMLKQQEVEARLNNSRVRQANILLKIAKETKIEEYKQVLHSHATKIVTGQDILPLPTSNKKTYSAKEIGDIVGVSANMVGRLANANRLKTETYGKLFHDKSAYSNKQVETFRYYEDVIPVLRCLLNKEVC